MLFDSSSGAGAAAAGMGVFFLVMGLVELALIGFMIYLYMRVAGKAGYPMAYGLLTLIPIANIVFIIMFAFKEWPIEQRVRQAEAQLLGHGGMLPPGSPMYPMPAAGGYQPAAAPTWSGQPSAPAPAPTWSGQPAPAADPFAPPTAPSAPGQPGSVAPYPQPGTPNPYGTDGPR